MQRVRIDVDASSGLEFLHEKQKPSIIYRDIRSSNILLFEDYKAKITDFNLSNQAPDMAAPLRSTRLSGTFGYHAPEYAMTGQLTQKSDVYSFGVVLLELLTGRKPEDHTMPRGQQSLVTWLGVLLTLGYYYIGTRGDINVWNPQVENPDDEYTSGQIWVLNGDHFAETAEAGWIASIS
ncbi:hypothetical protein MKX01_013793 [Papaver californicum]|nr:hypothetical protein MKX01_013793 [Papaver californicum]